MYDLGKNRPDGRRRRIPIDVGEACEPNSSEYLLLREMAHRINTN
jgi:hypothetical protein